MEKSRVAISCGWGPLRSSRCWWRGSRSATRCARPLLIVPRHRSLPHRAGWLCDLSLPGGDCFSHRFKPHVRAMAARSAFARRVAAFDRGSGVGSVVLPGAQELGASAAFRLWLFHLDAAAVLGFVWMILQQETPCADWWLYLAAPGIFACAGAGFALTLKGASKHARVLLQAMLCWWSRCFSRRHGGDARFMVPWKPTAAPCWRRIRACGACKTISELF